jgi:tetratricopeptide (TPR) repeat protein
MVKQRRDLLQQGQRLETRRGPYTVEGKLGVGLTCEVYRATRLSDGREAALKVMRPGLSAGMKERFLSEGYTLAKIMAAEDRLGDNLRLVPEFLAMEAEADPPYILLDFVSGQRIPELLRQQKRLDETIVLTVGWQFCRLLTLLHDDLNLTYADLKLENIWWLADRSQIKVTDWNVLGEKTPDNVASDLLRLSLYLYHMLTGAAIKEHRGEVVGSLDSAKGWAELSWGTQEILRRALHRNRQMRHHSASELSKALKVQCDLWAVDGKELLLNARRALDGAPDRESYVEARVLVDMAKRRPPVATGAVKDVEARIEEGLRGTDLLEIGRQYLSSGDYASAAQKFEEAAGRAAEPAVARRWAWLARAAQESGRRFDVGQHDAIVGLDYLTEGEYGLAAQYLERAYQTCQVQVLQQLEDEARLRLIMEEGSRARVQEDYAQAADAFRRALQIWETLPYKDLLGGEIGDLAAQVQEAERLAETVGAAQESKRAGQEAVERGRLEDASKRFSEALDKDPGNSEVLDAWRSAAEEQIGDGHFASALQLLERGMLRPDAADALQRQWDLASDLQEIEELFRQGEYELGTRGARHLVQAFAGYPVAANAMERLVADAHQRAVEASEIQAAEQLETLVQETDSSWLAQLAQRREVARKRVKEEQVDTVQRLLAEAARLSEERTLVDWEQAVPASRAILDTSSDVLSALRRADEILKHVEMMIRVGEPHWRELRDLRQEVQERLKHREALHDRLAHEHAEGIHQRLVDAEQLIRKAERLDELAERLHQVNESDLPLAERRAEALADALKMCEEALALDPDDDRASELRQQVRAQLGKGGAFAWSVVRKQADEVLARVEVAMEQATQAYALGQARPALNALQSIVELSGTTDGYLELAAQVKTAIGFEEWADNLPLVRAGDAEVLAQTEDFLAQRIPAHFWRAGELSVTLESIEAAALGRFSDVSYPDHYQFLPRLKEFLRANQARRRVEQAMEHGSPQSTDATWDPSAVLRSARGLVRAWVAKRWRMKRFAGGLATVANPQEELEGLTRNVINEVRQIEERSRLRRRRAALAALYSLGAILGILAIVLVGSLAIHRFGRPDLSQREPIHSIAQLLGLPERPIATPTPEPTATQPPATSTSVPPAATPLPPTALPVSEFLTQIADIRPTPPIPGSAFYLLDDLAATIHTTPTLSTHSSAGVGGSMQFTDREISGTVSWNMDMPLEPGLYEILASDPREKSEGVELTYDVLLDTGLVPPLVGTGSTEQVSSEFQEGDHWVSLGIYEIEDYGMLSIDLTLDRLEVTTDTVAGIDAMLIVAMEQPEPPAGIDLPPGGQPCLIVVEDPTYWEPQEEWQVEAEIGSWDGFRHATVFTDTSVVSATWQVERPLPEGDYDLCVLMPPSQVYEPRARVTYSALVGSESLDLVAEAQTGDKWVCLGPVHVGVGQALALTMESAAPTAGQVVADALALLPALPVSAED